MEIKSLTGNEICNIIRTSKKAEVRFLKIGELELHFGTKIVEEGTQLPQAGMHATPPQPGTVELEKTPESVELSEQDKEELLEHTVASLTVNDPEAFEDYITDELLHGGDHNEENERQRIE